MRWMPQAAVSSLLALSAPSGAKAFDLKTVDVVTSNYGNLIDFQGVAQDRPGLRQSSSGLNLINAGIVYNIKRSEGMSRTQSSAEASAGALVGAIVQRHPVTMTVNLICLNCLSESATASVNDYVVRPIYNELTKFDRTRQAVQRLRAIPEPGGESSTRAMYDAFVAHQNFLVERGVVPRPKLGVVTQHTQGAFSGVVWSSPPPAPSGPVAPSAIPGSPRLGGVAAGPQSNRPSGGQPSAQQGNARPLNQVPPTKEAGPTVPLAGPARMSPGPAAGQLQQGGPELRNPNPRPEPAPKQSQAVVAAPSKESGGVRNSTGPLPEVGQRLGAYADEPKSEGVRIGGTAAESPRPATDGRVGTSSSPRAPNETPATGSRANTANAREPGGVRTEVRDIGSDRRLGAFETSTPRNPSPGAPNLAAAAQTQDPPAGGVRTGSQQPAGNRIGPFADNPAFQRLRDDFKRPEMNPRATAQTGALPKTAMQVQTGIPEAYRQELSERARQQREEQERIRRANEEARRAAREEAWRNMNEAQRRANQHVNPSNPCQLDYHRVGPLPAECYDQQQQQPQRRQGQDDGSWVCVATIGDMRARGGAMPLQALGESPPDNACAKWERTKPPSACNRVSESTALEMINIVGNVTNDIIRFCAASGTHNSQKYYDVCQCYIESIPPR